MPACAAMALERAVACAAVDLFGSWNAASMSLPRETCCGPLPGRICVKGREAGEVREAQHTAQHLYMQSVKHIRVVFLPLPTHHAFLVPHEGLAIGDAPCPLLRVACCGDPDANRIQRIVQSSQVTHLQRKKQEAG